jgi:uncharacterized membrane protein YqjE
VNNGNDHKKTVVGEILDVLSDHLELAGLEARYESQTLARRFTAILVTAILAFGAFVMLQIAIIFGLAKVGIGIGWASLSLAAFYGVLGTVVFWKFGRRDPRGGGPFAGTRREVKESLQWIQKLFS